MLSNSFISSFRALSLLCLFLIVVCNINLFLSNSAFGSTEEIVFGFNLKAVLSPANGAFRIIFNPLTFADE